MSITEQVTDEQADAGEQTRARYPDEEGYIERDGVRVFYEVYGTGSPTILFCPTWTMVHSRVWKMQIPYLARHHRVVVFVSRGSQRTLLLAAEHPERVLGLVLISPWFPASRSLGGLRYRIMSHPRVQPGFKRKPITTRGWAKFNAVHFRRDFRDFVEWFAAMSTAEAHSIKGFDDVVGGGLETDPDTLALTVLAAAAAPAHRRDQLALARRVQCPVLVISGTKDKVTSHADARALAKATGGKLMAI